jgi:hypothetical protein
VRMGKLEISLYGPFVLMLGCDPIEIYAPRCIGHYASIFTTEDEAPLEGDWHNGMNKIYSLKTHGIRPNASTITPVNQGSHLCPPKGYKLCGDPRRAWFCLQLPKPTHAVGIKRDPVTVNGTSAPNVPNPHEWATAARLVFDYDMNSPDIEVVEGPTSILKTTLRDYSASAPSASTRFDITIRHVGPFVVDPAHDDARGCFEATTKLFQSGTVDLDWELDFSKLPSKFSLFGRTGSDCGSPLLISS